MYSIIEILKRRFQSIIVLKCKIFGFNWISYEFKVKHVLDKNDLIQLKISK